MTVALATTARVFRRTLPLLAVFGLAAPVVFGGEASEAPTKRVSLNHPLFDSWYTAEKNRPLASCSAGTISERDFLLFRLTTRKKQPDIFKTWEDARLAKDREKAEKVLREGLREMAYTMVMARQSPAPPMRELDRKFIRYLKYPVYQWVWIDKVLRPSLDIRQLDVIKYYHDNAGEFYRPESVRVRYIFREVPESALIMDRDRLMADMQSLRARAVAGEDFVELAREFSDAASAVRGGELPRVERGMFVSEFESQAFALEPGQISPVFWGPGGLYIVQLLDKMPEEQISFAEAEDDIRETVEQKALAFLYDYRLYKLVLRRNYELYTARYVPIPLDHVICDVRKLTLTKGELVDMFPYLIVEPLEISQGMVSGILKEILMGELVAYEVEKRGLGNDPLLVEAERIARQFWQAQEATLKALEVPLTFGESEVREFYDTNREALGYQPLKRVFRLEATVRDPYLRHPSQLAALRQVMEDEFRQVLEDFRIAFLEDQARAQQNLLLMPQLTTGPLTAASLPRDGASTEALLLQRRLMETPRSLELLAEASTLDFEFGWVDYGYLTPDEKYYSYAANLGEGELGPLREVPQTGMLYSFFVSRYIPGETAPYEEVRMHARRQYIASRQDEAIEQLRGRLKNEADLQIRLPEPSVSEP